MDPRVAELHCIMPLVNVPSVLVRGILSHELASKLEHASVALDAIQERRDKRKVPGGLRLHQYANLYFHARNPMMFKRRDHASTLCVLRVSTDVLRLPGVVLTDQNASSDYARLLAPDQWRHLPFDDIFAPQWRHPDDPIALYRHRSRKCAEVLVPQRVPASHLIGAYVVDDQASRALTSHGFGLSIRIDSELFFRR
jgi:hypothetical protein